ncbi:MAG: dihydrolipoamide acetyltransferase family protein [Polyangiaceae bacterium]
MVDFLMPSLGADMTSGVLTSWLKQPGDSVKRGDIIAEVETDKGIIEVEVYCDGVLEELLVEPGVKVPVGTPLAKIREPGDKQASPAIAASTISSETPAAALGSVSALASAESVPSDRVRVSPAARRLARELEVDLARVQGSGPGGVIQLDDIRAAAGSAPPVKEGPASALPEPAEARARMRAAIAAAMSRSKREIPHYYVSTTLDVAALVQWLDRHNAKRPPPERLIAGVAFVKATALALREFPDLNGRWEDGVVHNPSIHVGSAIALRGGGLVAPALHSADTKSLGQLMSEFRDLVERSRRGQLRSSEYTDATITVTSMGERGVETVFGVVNPPQVAIVGFGKIVERPWVSSGEIRVTPVVTVSLSADHRVSDGHQGAMFLNRIERLLQEPDAL